MKSLNTLAVLLLFVATGGFAQTGVAPPKALPAAAATTAMTDGEVRKVDKEAGKLTLRHGPLVDLDMPAMTMVFRVSDPNVLNLVKEGDKVRFVAEKVGGQLTVTKLETVK